MLSRKEQEQAGIELPAQWIEEVRNLLESTYAAQCRQFAKKFEVYGLTYPDELFLAVSLLNQNDSNSSPLTYLLSKDLTQTERPTKILDNLVDSIGLFFENYFNNPQEDPYISVWQENEMRGVKFFYRASRENIALTLQANKLLAQED